MDTRALTCTSPFASEVVHFKALISLAGGASLHLHLVIIEGTSALCKLAHVYVAITHNTLHTLTRVGCTNTYTDLEAHTHTQKHS